MTNKNIVLLSDGTGNSASNPHKTNVWRLYKAIVKCPEKNQLAFYDDGVGTSSFIVTKLLGQAFGWGLKRNVKELYQNLCRVYSEDDRIFIFGYSRGAYTARILAALIAHQGIIRYSGNEVDLAREVEEAYDRFRHDTFVPSVLTSIPWIWRWLVKDTKSAPKSPDDEPDNKPAIEGFETTPLIEMLGVWDTVDAYGAPIDELTRGWDMIIWPLTAKDRNLSSEIGAAYHALALDEQREAFEPMLWNEDGRSYTENRPENQILEQVWFSGVHANVGGGNPDDSLAYVSLNWMIRKAKKHKLEIEPVLEAEYKVAADFNGPLYNNRAGFGNIYRFAPRKVETLCLSKKPGLFYWFWSLFNRDQTVPNEVQIDCPKIHRSVFERIRDGRDGYAPINLPEHYCVVDSDANGNEKILKHSSKTAKTIRIETGDEAKDRRVDQSNIWNKVWLQKILYYVLVFSGVAFVIAPSTFLNKTSGDINQSADIFFGSIGDLFRFVPQYIGMIPGLEPLRNWANNYNDHPYVFVFGIIFLLFLVMAGTQVQRLRNSMMRKRWEHLWGKDKDQDEDERFKLRPPERNKLAEWLDSYRVMGKDENTIKWSVADNISHGIRLFGEFLSVVFFLLLLYLAFWKVAITVMDGTGYVCAPPKPRNPDLTNPVNFDPTKPCVDTGFHLAEGTDYIMEFKVPKNWTDKTIKAGTNGLLETPSLVMNLAIPIRRHISKDWFQPIGRIGNTYFDRYTAKYPENKADPGPDGFLRKPQYCRSIKFKARQTGRLYIYLNDAVAPWPFDRWQFYRNNCKSLDGQCRPDELAKLKLSKAGKDSGSLLCPIDRSGGK